MRNRERAAWLHMLERCTNPNNSSWKNYGGRGIAVCPEWQDGFAAFVAHIGPRPSPEHSLDRINNDGNYEPGNVRWATRSEQMSNTRPHIVARDEQEERQTTKIFHKLTRDAGLTRRDLQRCLQLSHTSIDGMMSGKKRDPISGALAIVRMFEDQGAGHLVPLILAYVAGAEVEALKELAKVVTK